MNKSRMASRKMMARGIVTSCKPMQESSAPIERSSKPFHKELPFSTVSASSLLASSRIDRKPTRQWERYEAPPCEKETSPLPASLAQFLDLGKEECVTEVDITENGLNHLGHFESGASQANFTRDSSRSYPRKFSNMENGYAELGSHRAKSRGPTKNDCSL